MPSPDPDPDPTYSPTAGFMVGGGRTYRVTDRERAAIAAGLGARPLTADPITHLVLSLCARTEDITRDRAAPDAPWRLKLRGERIANMRALCNLGVALTSLEAAGLIEWFLDYDCQYSGETVAGKETLSGWDAGVLAGGES